MFSRESRSMKFVMYYHESKLLKDIAETTAKPSCVRVSRHSGLYTSFVHSASIDFAIGATGMFALQRFTRVSRIAIDVPELPEFSVRRTSEFSVVIDIR